MIDVAMPPNPVCRLPISRPVVNWAPFVRVGGTTRFITCMVEVTPHDQVGRQESTCWIVYCRRTSEYP
jgi:hypothetical protein